MSKNYPAICVGPRGYTFTHLASEPPHPPTQGRPLLPLQAHPPLTQATQPVVVTDQARSSIPGRAGAIWPRRGAGGRPRRRPGRRGWGMEPGGERRGRRGRRRRRRRREGARRVGRARRCRPSPGCQCGFRRFSGPVARVYQRINDRINYWIDHPREISPGAAGLTGRIIG